MKLVNPLHYPVAILVGGISLVLGVRFAKLPSLVMLPLSGAIAILTSIPLSEKEANKIDIDNPAVVREIQSVKQQASLLVSKAEDLRNEAKKLLTSSTQLELFSAVEYACNTTQELPGKIDRLIRKLQGSDSLLSPEEIDRQLTDVKQKYNKNHFFGRWSKILCYPPNYH